MHRGSKLLFILSIVFLLLGGLLFLLGITNLPPTLYPSGSSVQTPEPNTNGQKVLPASTTQAKVTRIIDGDTIEIEGGIKVRYIGINTPETVDPRKGVQCFGHEAANKNKELVEGRVIRLEKDISETDKFGRLLRYVYLDGLFVNDYLVREGFAYADTFPPDVRHKDQFLSAQQEARSQNKGLWTSCGLTPTR